MITNANSQEYIKDDVRLFLAMLENQGLVVKVFDCSILLVSLYDSSQRRQTSLYCRTMIREGLPTAALDRLAGRRDTGP